MMPKDAHLILFAMNSESFAGWPNTLAFGLVTTDHVQQANVVILKPAMDRCANRNRLNGPIMLLGKAAMEVKVASVFYRF